MNLLIAFVAGAVAGIVAVLLWQGVRGRRNTTTPPFLPAEASAQAGGPARSCLAVAGGHPSSTEEGRKTETLILRQKREKEEDKERMYGLLETNTPLTVGHVESMLGIPESTATRYFDELEKEGKVRQVGKTGAGVHYERV